MRNGQAIPKKSKRNYYNYTILIRHFATFWNDVIYWNEIEHLWTLPAMFTSISLKFVLEQ